MDIAMTAMRLIPLPIHAALRMASGLALMVAPFLLGFGPAGTLVAVVVGAVVAGVSMSGVADERGYTALPVSTLHAFDWGTVLGVFGGAAVLAIAGDAIAAVTLASIAALWLIDNLSTRYSLRG
jgi:hypothetical protein